MPKIEIKLSDRTLNRLKEICKYTGKSRSAIITNSLKQSGYWWKSIDEEIFEEMK